LNRYERKPRVWPTSGAGTIATARCIARLALKGLPGHRFAVEAVDRRGAHGRLLTLIERQSEAELSQPTAAELKDFAPTRMDLLFSMAWHEGAHQRQSHCLP